MNFKRLVKHLPDAYQEVEYIQTDGNAYINTGYVPKLGDRYDFIFSEQSGTDNAVIFGSRSSGAYNTSHDQVYLNLTGNAKIIFFEGTANTILQDRAINVPITLSLSLDESISYDDMSTQPLYLFLLNNMGTAAAQSSMSRIKIYRFEITNGNTIRNFVPCYHKSDNIIGMYDTVNDVFYTNSGTGSFSKGNDVNIWHDTPHYIHNTSTDTITTLPADIYANDTTATVGLKGNMVQTGTPTPTTPIQPSECGERTGNLLDKLQIVPVTDKTTIEQVPNGVIVENIVAAYGGRITLDVEQNAQYCLTFEKEIISGNYTGYVIVFAGTSQSTQLAKATQTPSGSCTFNTRENNKVNIWFYIAGNAIGTIKYYNITLNKGDDYLEYEPYGYKIPISSANTTTPIYLGEVQTTRRIGKIVLDGTESNLRYSKTYSGAYIEFSDTIYTENLTALCCSHYYAKPNAGISVILSYGNNVIAGRTVQPHLWIIDSNITSLSDFKTFLAQQYAAGTPVCVWYILATPQTAVVNEPLRKIGNYADEVSGITIPTIAGANTISVDTTLQPSEVSATYKGWHPVADVHERESGAWT